jgi:CPA2 family monovalent cation:H+ antiporter-2
MLIVASLTMLLTPALAALARRLGSRLEEREAAGAAAASDRAQELEGHVVIAGFGRVGQMIASILDREDLPCIAIDNDPAIVSEAQSAGLPVRFGDASRVEVLEAARVSQASALVITIGNARHTELLTVRMREAAPHVPLFVRARDKQQAEQLAELGATLAVPETVEASLQLAGRVLEGCGLNEEAIQQRILFER